MARAWAVCAGLDGLDLCIDPADEMLGFLAAASPRVDAHRFEYLRSGQEAFVVFEHALAACGVQLAGTRRVLDFACGYGRVTRFLVHALGPDRVVASEIDTAALDFVRRTFRVEVLASASDPAALRPAGPFDAILVGSLFSHLPRPRFIEWLAVLGHALSESGLLVFTTHGAAVHGQAAQGEHIPARAADGFTFVPISETDRLGKQEYGTSFVRPDVVLELVREAGLTPLGYAEQEVWNLQDVFVARRGGHGDTEPRRLPGAPILYGRIERAHLPRPGHGWVGGGTRILERQAPLREVRLVVDGVEVATAELGEPIRHTDGVRREPFVTTEWYTEGDATALLPGMHTVCAIGTAASGRREVFGARGLRVP